MRLSRLVLPAAAIAALGAAAYAERPATHVVEYRLPDGGVARVRYTGDVPPRLVMVPAGATAVASPFDMFDQVATMMDEQADAMFAQIADMQRAAREGTTPAGLASTPAGAHWTSVSSSSAGGRTCTTEVSMVSQGGGKAPRVVRRSSGDYGGVATPMQAAPAAPARAAMVPHDSI
jgi:hypothetical protein